MFLGGEKVDNLFGDADDISSSDDNAGIVCFYVVVLKQQYN